VSAELTSGHSGEIAPGAKGAVPSGTVLGSGEAVTAELEVVVDPAVGGEEALCVARRLEALHLPFSSSRGPVRHLGPVVEVAALPVFDPRQYLAFRRAVLRTEPGEARPGASVQLQRLGAELGLGRTHAVPPRRKRRGRNRGVV
jgi:hypothetical protein